VVPGSSPGGPTLKVKELRRIFVALFIFLKKGLVDTKGLIPIYLRIAVNGKRTEISTSQKIESSKWGSEVQ
jgi:hypothetical protein